MAFEEEGLIVVPKFESVEVCKMIYRQNASKDIICGLFSPGCSSIPSRVRQRSYQRQSQVDSLEE